MLFLIISVLVSMSFDLVKEECLVVMVKMISEINFDAARFDYGNIFVP